MSHDNQKVRKSPAAATGTPVEQTAGPFVPGGLFLKPLSLSKSGKKKGPLSVPPPSSATLSGTAS